MQSLADTGHIKLDFIRCMLYDAIVWGVAKRGPRSQCPSLRIDFVRLVQVLLSVVRSLRCPLFSVIRHMSAIGSVR